MKSEKGFTLIEVVIAIALLGIIGAGFLMALSGASKAIILADERTTAESLVRSQMEYVKSQGYRPAPDYDSGSPSGGEVTYDRLTTIPANYSIWSYNRANTLVEATSEFNSIFAVPWDTDPLDNEPKDIDDGIQRIKLVIKHYGEEVITLEGYKVSR